MRTFIVKWEDEILEIIQDDDGLFIIPDVLRGIGTALKPASEHWILARKPIEGTVAYNVLKYGVGGLNIDGCRVGYTSEDDKWKPTQARKFGNGAGGMMTSVREDVTSDRAGFTQTPNEQGRWPANLILSHSKECGETCVDGCPIKLLDEQSGYSKSYSGGVTYNKNTMHLNGLSKEPSPRTGHDDSGGASRYFKTFNSESDGSLFMYCAKASKKDRNSGGRIVEYKLKADAPQSVVEKIIKELNM
jgi:site-specific DNA-methyltransferase (adenine-specific)